MRATPEDFQRDFNRAHPPHAYRIEEIIGRGGQADVRRGYALESPDEPLAIKVFHAVDAEIAELQSNEAERIKALDHPNIIKVHWHGAHVIGSGQSRLRRRSNFDPQVSHFVVTEYADGGTLKERTETSAQHPEEIVWAIAQIISGTAYAHGEGRPADAVRLIHCDIKPSNVLFSTKEEPLKLEGFPDLDSFGNAKLSDFGVAIYGPGRTVDNEEYTVTTTQIATGTLPYMSPEQFYGKAVPASDDYAIGVMAYRSITGRLPIIIESSRSHSDLQLIASWIKAHEDNAVPAFADVAPERMNKLNEAVEPVIARSLGKSPQDRYPSTGDFLEEYRVAVVAGMDAMRRDAVYIDLAKAGSDGSSLGQAAPLDKTGDAYPEADPPTEQLFWPTEDGTTLLDPNMGLDPTKKLSEPKRFPRRRILGGVGLIGGAVALGVINLLNPPSTETTQSPESHTDEQIVTAAAKEVLAAMEANGMADRTAMLLKQLAYYDPDFVWQKITDLQKNDKDANAPWLAADFTIHSLTKPAALMNTYKSQGKYDAMAIVAASVAGATIGSHDPELTQIQSEVNDVISFCAEKPELLPHLKIISAALSPKLPITLHAFETKPTNSTQILNDLEDAKLFWGVNALGRALAPNYPDIVKSTIEHYDQRVQNAADLEAELYDMLADLTIALAPFDRLAAGIEMANMGSRSAGIADERTQTVAVEVAKYNTTAILQYIDAHNAEPIGARISAVALAVSAPDQAKKLLTTTPEPVKSWIDASLNLRDDHILPAAVQALLANQNLLKNYGAELAAALLVSRRVG